MTGLDLDTKEKINKIVEDMFDRIALQFVGDIPKFKNRKTLVISSKPNLGLTNLFVQAMSNRPPNEIERDALKSLLDTSGDFIDALKNKTKMNLTQRFDTLIREANIKKESVKQEDIDLAVDEELKKAKSALKVIAESESTKLRNVGSAMDISRVAASIGDEDPSVFFVMVRDSSTCSECIKLHTIDGVTPRVWKFSELKQGYHKRGEPNPSAFGLHPHCRCTLTYITKGFGFDEKGRVKFISSSHDQYSKQK
jgi:hypothetical protein